MSGFVPEKTHEFTFEGDTVLVTLTPLKNEDMGRLIQFAEKTGEDDEGNAKFSIQPQRMGDFSVEVGKMLPKYVKDFKGLNDANGNPVSLETACTYRYFMELMMEIGQTIMASNELSEEEGKNSDAPPSDSTGG